LGDGVGRPGVPKVQKWSQSVRALSDGGVCGIKTGDMGSRHAFKRLSEVRIESFEEDERQLRLITLQSIPDFPNQISCLQM
jgi:ribosomal protein L20A (L18A)